MELELTFKLKIMINKNQIGIITFLITISILGCKKQNDFLNAKTNQALAIPSTLYDLNALLNKEEIFNYDEPILGTVTADDDYYITSAVWNQDLNFVTERNAYIWANDIYESELTDVGSWNSEYEKVYVANTVLDGLNKVKNSSQILYNEVKGTALFYRSLAFYNLVQTYSLPYDEVTANVDLGIPLRLNSDLNITSIRATVKETYNQIFGDLAISLDLLPETSANINRPSRIAVQALLARINLAIRNYEKAFYYSNECLKKNILLTDYNSLTPGSSNISSTVLKEDIFHTSLFPSIIANRRYTIINPNLYNEYADNDLRKSYFFTLIGGEVRFKGTYDFTNYKYSGLAYDEILLIRAECYARNGNSEMAMNDLNNLLDKRYKKNSFIPISILDPHEALLKILLERRKELIFRGLRWTDIKRFNKEKGFEITLKRTINGIEHILLPNDIRYALPIPKAEIELSGIQQNLR